MISICWAATMPARSRTLDTCICVKSARCTCTHSFKTPALTAAASDSAIDCTVPEASKHMYKNGTMKRELRGPIHDEALDVECVAIYRGSCCTTDAAATLSMQ